MEPSQVNVQNTKMSLSVSYNPMDAELLSESEIDTEVAAELMEDWDKSKEIFENYKKAKYQICETQTNPVLVQVEKLIYPTLKNFITKTLHKAIESDCCSIQKTNFDGIDFLSECLYNSNPKDPTRSSPWTYILDLPWAKEHLEIKPRPYFPLSLLMSRSMAATYIQAHMRGFWVRRRANLQEIRTFWKNIMFKRESDQGLYIILNDESKKKLEKNQDSRHTTSDLTSSFHI